MTDARRQAAASRIVLALARAAVAIDARLGRAAWEPGMRGTIDVVNVHGERVRPLDRFADEAIAGALSACGVPCALVSEERAAVELLTAAGAGAVHTVCVDPLDGSGGLDANRPVGTIFGVYGPLPPARWSDGPLPAGRDQVAAGYVLFGPATLLVCAVRTARGLGPVRTFGLDRARGRFVRTRDRMACPREGQVYSVSEGNRASWPPDFAALVDGYKARGAGGTGPRKLRHAGAFVADVHEVLVRGGIFAYPRTTEHPDGKLRLLYELAPMAMVCEAAGGRATDGRRDILDVAPASVHACSPIFVGSRAAVTAAHAPPRALAPARPARAG